MRRPINSFRAITSRHGQATTMSKFRRHLGIDYSAPVNTPIYSPVNGTIIATPYSSAGGQMVHIREDGNERIHRLLHLNSEQVSPGQRVSEGQIIAMSGNTGISTGPHLHWDVRRAGTTWDASFDNYFDPEALIAQAAQPNRTLRVGANVFLKGHVDRWRFYPPNVQPKAGLETGFLNPKRFGGLNYRVLAVPFPNTATIQTQSFGRVNIFIDNDAVIS